MSTRDRGRCGCGKSQSVRARFSVPRHNSSKEALASLVAETEYHDRVRIDELTQIVKESVKHLELGLWTVRRTEITVL